MRMLVDILPSPHGACMRYLSFIFAVLLSSFSFSVGAVAADQSSAVQASSEASQPELQKIEDLISTLESEADRGALVEKLKLLLEVNEPAPTDSLVEGLIDLDSTGNGLANELMRILNSYGFSDSLIGDLLVLLVALFVIGIFVFLNGMLAIRLEKRMRKIAKRLELSRDRFQTLFSLQRWAGYLFGSIVSLYACTNVLSDYYPKAAEFLAFESVFSSAFMLIVVALVFMLIWEGVNALLEFIVHKNSHLSSSRFQTITPIIRNILLFTLSLLSIMVVLSELGIDIMPLLAGAGVLGIAVGFGAQTLVKDFLTGLTVIFEDLLQIGDVIQLGDHFGVVEKISLRKIQIRDLDGAVITVPFGDISVVKNLTKDFSFALFNIGVAYRENIDDVLVCLKEIDEDLRNDEVYGDKILEPMEIFGLDEFADSAVMIKARIKTKSHDRWNVMREYNRRMKIAFDERNIEIPFPHQTIYFGEDKSGRAPSAKIELDKPQETKPEVKEEAKSDIKRGTEEV